MEHEGSHRKAWRCPEHPDAVYKSQSGLEEHFRRHHGESIEENQLPTLVKVGETHTIDQRRNCPICLASANIEGIDTLQDHIANHLERIAAFSLPIQVDDDLDGGGSSRASRGETESSARRAASGSSDTDDTSDYNELGMGHDDDAQLVHIPNSVSSSSVDLQQLQTADGPRESLKQSTLHTLPDDSGQRLNLLFTTDTEEGPQGSDDLNEGIPHMTENEVDEHVGESEDLRVYLLSLPGAQSVEFYMRYGMWNGTIHFKDSEFAALALRSFDMAKYPRVQLRQKRTRKEALKFVVLRNGQKRGDPFHPQVDAVESSPPASLSSKPRPISVQGDAASFSPILTVAGVPNLSTLYRSQELLPRDDQNRVPNHGYNEIISLCYYDITRLKVDAIGTYGR